jgi:tetratricopeptide (TPR) repeat protein
LAQRYMNLELEKMQGYADEAVRVFRTLASDGSHAHRLGLGIAMHHAGRALLLGGDLTGTERRLAEAEAVLAALEPRSHVALSEVRQTAVGCLLHQFRFADAAALARRAEADTRSALGPDDPNVLFTATMLGRLLHQTGQRSEGRTLLQDALSAALRTRGDADPLYVGMARRDLGQCLCNEGDFAGAEPLLRAAAASMRQPYAGSPQLAGVFNLLAELLTAQGECGEATALADECEQLLQGFASKATGGTGGSALPVNSLLMLRARLALARGDAPGALELVNQYVPYGQGLRLPMLQFRFDFLASSV